MAGNQPAISGHRIQLTDLRMHYAEAGDEGAPPVILLHGWPQTCAEWRLVMPGLAGKYRVIAPDLRGLGDSSRPETGYDSRTIAGDIVQLMDHLGFRTVKLVGHDLGALAAYAMAAAWRDRVEKLVMVDVLLPGLGLEKLVKLGPDGWGIWHFPFHATVDLAELLVSGREREYLSIFFRNMSNDPLAIQAAQIDEYARAYAQPGALRAGFKHYRAFHENTLQNNETLKTKLTIPVLAVGGSVSIGNGIIDEMKIAAEDVVGRIAPDCGHWVPEEQPAWLVERLIEFFA
jgi:pimeloyl-ACP methyl ester carboxylesterase